MNPSAGSIEPPKTQIARALKARASCTSSSRSVVSDSVARRTMTTSDPSAAREITAPWRKLCVSLIEEASFAALDDGLQPGMHSEAPENRADVIPCRLDRDAQAARDCVGAQTLGE